MRQLVLAVCVILWVPAVFVFDSMDANGMLGRMQLIWATPAFWLSIALCVVISNGYIAVLKIYQRYYHPQYRDIIHELQICTPPGPKADAITNQCVFPLQILCVCVAVLELLLSCIRMLEWPFTSHIDAYIKEQAKLLVPDDMLKETRMRKLIGRDATRTERGLTPVHTAEIQAIAKELTRLGVNVSAALPASARM
jgi:hypothetical protein